MNALRSGRICGCDSAAGIPRANHLVRTASAVGQGDERQSVQQTRASGISWTRWRSMVARQADNRILRGREGRSSRTSTWWASPLLAAPPEMTRWSGMIGEKRRWNHSQSKYITGTAFEREGGDVLNLVDAANADVAAWAAARLMRWPLRGRVHDRTLRTL